MAKKKSEVDRLREELASKDKALDLAMKGLYKIGNLDPVSQTLRGEARPNGLGFVRAFRKAQEVAEKTLLDVADAEVVNV
jgi:hypothetical protein